MPPQPATLAPGAQLACTGSYTLTQADIDAGQVANTATGDSDQTAPGEIARDRAAPPAPALTLTKAGTVDMPWSCRARGPTPATGSSTR